MTTNECLQAIRAHYSLLSEKERRIADFILGSPHKVIYFSISELASASEVAEATVFRFSKHVGYKGFQELKIALARQIVKPEANIHEVVQETDDTDTITKKIFNEHKRALDDSVALIKEETVDGVVKHMTQATRIDIYGSGGSGVVASDAYHKFMRLGIPTQAFTDDHQQLMSAALLKENSVAIGISNSGSNRDVVDAIQTARDKGAVTIAIANNRFSPLTKAAHYTLSTSARESLFRTEAMASRIVQLAVIDLLYVTAAMQMKSTTLENLEAIRQAIAAKRY
ncbi:DNA-binding MurR/RpiR family transcriptional regulator [Geomicrobium halophilum]|uniref:DNA-binding MurR/RpiR family transcriptional regulator n=1 Tax=Geomicrobium halophilum TaxID=549000 RepID=A0A841Q024_9BACL|nr:MurR/RpiR family transcriptional regulator [Geomicrobium halophilum]MBB6448558.1 DNA-binding MurR/RpiR family transcriptional regulator [Geomicrobium halophilum]